jgi:hypothetical protein
MLTSVGHDLSDLQDDDVPEESVDDSDSERGLPPAASKFRAHCINCYTTSTDMWTDWLPVRMHVAADGDCVFV